MKIFRILGTFFLFASVAVAAENNDIVFGLSNWEGTKVISTSTIENPSHVVSALARDGQVVKLRFLKKRPAAEDYNGRQSAYQFENMPGAVYEVVGQAIKKPGSCLLVKPEFLKKNKLLTISQTNSPPLESDSAKRVETSLKRTIDQSWVLVLSDEGQVVATVLFKKNETGAMAGLALIEKGMVNFHEFQKGHVGSDCWRVDDGGIFDGSQIEVLFAYRREGKIGIGYSWRGAEGESLSVIETEGNKFLDVKSGYHYQAPL